MNKHELMQLAEHGVRQRLSELQAEINKLARAFPHIVNHQGGGTPAVLPLAFKATTGVRKTIADRTEEVRVFLSTHPGATTREIARAVGLSNNHVLKVAAPVATIARRGNTSGTWTLKGTAARAMTNGSGTSATTGWDKARKAKFARAQKKRWAEMSPAEKKARQAKMVAGRAKPSHDVRNAAAEATE